MCKIRHFPLNELILLDLGAIWRPIDNIMSVPPFMLQVAALVFNLPNIYECVSVNTVVQVVLYYDGYAYSFMY